MRRLAAAVLGGAALTAVTAVVGAAPATAHDDEVGLSRDGVHWTTTLTEPLFDPRVRWVPGDVRVASFWVRNQAADNGDLAVSIQRVETDALLDTGFLRVSARAAGRPWTTVAQGGRQELVDRDDLRPDTPLLVEVRVALDESAPNRTMVLATDLDLDVTLRDSDATAPGGDVAGDTADDVAGGGLLPGTGSSMPAWMPPLGLALIGTGAFVLVGRRGRDDEDDLEPILTSRPQSP